MPNPRALETIAGAAAKGAEEIGSKLLGDTFASTMGRAAERTAAKPASEALSEHVRASFLGNPEQALAAPSDAVRKQLAKAVAGAGEAKLPDLTLTGERAFVEGEWVARADARIKVVAKGFQRTQEGLQGELKTGNASLAEQTTFPTLRGLISPRTAFTDPREGLVLGSGRFSDIERNLQGVTVSGRSQLQEAIWRKAAGLD